MEVKEGSTVKVHYTGKFTDDSVFDTSEGKEPLAFTIGSQQVIKGFEDVVMGLKAGDKATTTIPPAEAYGEVQEKLVQEIKKEQVPGEVQVGQMLQGTTPDGRPLSVKVSEVNEKTIKIDANHPLAGKTLVFDVEVVEVS